VLAQTGKPSDAVHQTASAMTAYQSMGATYNVPLSLSYLAKAYADLCQFEDAWCCIDEATAAANRTKERCGWGAARIIETLG
jgi:hypothetical protein